MTGADPFTLENPLESAVYEELTCATSTPSVIGVDEEDPDDPEGTESPEDPEELEESSTVELLVTLVELREMASLPEESWIALESLPLDGSV